MSSIGAPVDSGNCSGSSVIFGPEPPVIDLADDTDDSSETNSDLVMTHSEGSEGEGRPHRGASYWYPGMGKPPFRHQCRACRDNEAPCSHCAAFDVGVGFICDYCGGCCRCCNCDRVAEHKRLCRQMESDSECSDSDSVRSSEASSSQAFGGLLLDDENSAEDFDLDFGNDDDGMSDLSTMSSLLHTGVQEDNDKDDEDNTSVDDAAEDEI